MKFFCKIFFIGLCVCRLMMYAQAHTVDLKVVATGLKNDNGVVVMTLCRSKEEYRSKNAAQDAYRYISTGISKGRAEYVFRDIEPGRYGVKLFHDANANGEIDTNFLGIPKEGYGFSNNAKGFMGPPGFKKLIVEVVAGAPAVEIKMKYF